MNYWIDRKQIIVITGEHLLFGTYTQQQLKSFSSQLDNGVIPTVLTGIDLKYIASFEFNEEAKNIIIELGKGSIETLNISDTTVRKNVMDKLMNFSSEFRRTNPSNTRTWNSFWRAALAIVLFATIILTLTRPSGVSPGSKAIGLLSDWVNDTFQPRTVAWVAFSFLALRIALLVHQLRRNKMTIRMVRNK